MFTDILKFSQGYITLVVNTGIAFLGPKLTKKWFGKLTKPLEDLIYINLGLTKEMKI